MSTRSATRSMASTRIRLCHALLAAALLTSDAAHALITGKGTRRCGTSWAEANASCIGSCPDNDNRQCPEGLSCWSMLSEEPCKALPRSDVPEVAPSSAQVHKTDLKGDGSRRCGLTWQDANSRCKVACANNDDRECPKGETCWSFLSLAPCKNGYVEPPAEQRQAAKPGVTSATGKDSSAASARPRKRPQPAAAKVQTKPAAPPPAAPPPFDLPSKGPPIEGRRRTLVTYVYADSDGEYYSNLLYFVKEGMQLGPNEELDDTQFIIVVQCDDPADQDVTKFPKLPSNAMYVFHKNECYDWGTYGWVLKAVNISEYTHFMFINCSVRGPFMPRYARRIVDWKTAFLDLVTDEVKLVGPIISCEEVHFPVGDAINPHVQSYAVATDLTGLKVLMRSPTVFKCHNDWMSAVLLAELGSSRNILDAGYNIGSMMLRYRGVDWRVKSNWNCNRRANPFKHNSYDGVDINLFEAMFVKFKHSYKHMKVSYTMKAIDVEMSQRATRARANVLTRFGQLYAHDLAAKQVCFSQMRGARDCFNPKSYRNDYPEYANMSDQAVWEKYLTEDQFTDRVARVECKVRPAARVLKTPSFVIGGQLSQTGPRPTRLKQR